MTDPMKNFKFCVTGRRKESITKETIANLPKINIQDLIDRIYVKPYVSETSCPDPSTELIRPSKLKESRTISTSTLSKLEPLPVLKAAQTKYSLDLSAFNRSAKKRRTTVLPQLYQNGPIGNYKDYRKGLLHAGPENLYGMTNIHEIIKIIRMNPQIDFVYLTPFAKKNSVNYHYYNLKLVPYKEIDKSDYCTVSQRGVMRVRLNEDNSFISLERFDEEFTFFIKLIKIRLFKLFRQWKAFSMWRKNVKFEKFQIAQVYLKQYLFYMDDSLRPSLLNSREVCLKMEEMNMCKFKKDYLYTLEAFIREQMEQLKFVSDRLHHYRDQIKLIVMTGCRKVFASFNYTMSEPTHDSHKMTLRATHINRTFIESIAGNKEMTYTEQAQKRNLCKRLVSFIKLVDYVMANTLHSMVVAATQEVVLQLVRHLKKMPKEEILEWMKVVEEAIASPPNPDRIKKMVDEKKGTKVKLDKAYGAMHIDEVNLPLFSIEFQLKEDALILEPDEDLYQMTLYSLSSQFQETVLAIPNFMTDPFFNIFMGPISEKVNETFKGPDLTSMFKGDKYVKVLIENVILNIGKGFQSVYIYKDTFKEFVDFYKDNQNFSMEVAKNENHDVPFFANGLEKYHMQCRMIDVIQARKSLGLFLADAVHLKNGLIPSPLNCLDVFNTLLPWKARKEAERLTSELQDAKFTLEFTCSTTQDYVNQLLFLDIFQERIDGLVKESEVVKEMYELLDIFAVPTPPEDFALYATLVPSINLLYSCIDKVLGEQDKNRTLFNASLDKDIVEFNKELKVLKQQCQNQAILDPITSITAAYEILEKLLSKMKELQERASQFRGYQKALKVPVTEFSELDDVNDEIKLKQLLWDSIVQWDKNIQEWMDVKLDTLDPDDLTNTTLKFLKICNQLEKGLPPNGLVPKLKERIEKMKVKLPMITDLRNLSLKPRHWELIESVFEYTFTPDEPLTLGRLEQIKAFRFAERVQDISAQASSEASLEVILKKVEDSWKTLEFVVVPYKDQKDVYILGGVDDIQMVLDDSNVNIATIASSHHSKPIKPKVDEWAKQLDIFGKTLDAWLACQRSWIYFESIFTAPDIQRQLPSESKLFTTVDKSFKDIMRKVYKVPLAIRAGTQPGLLESLQNNNVLLEQIQKCLDAYLESKRVVFPRFYFLSNDEMLEILAQTRNPQAVQPHLRKCFDAIHRLEFAGVNIDNLENLSATNEILSMISPEGERVAFGKGLKARGNVEEWLGRVEEVMVMTIKKLIVAAIGSYTVPGKENWIINNASQVVLTVSQMMWCRDVTEVLEKKGDRIGPMKELEMKSIHNLNKLATLVRGKLAPLDRSTICTLITIDVHARDIITELVKGRITKVDMFEWKKQLRYYWDKEDENMLVKMSNSTSIYGCEYLGNSPRLVITPLTDRCYLCLMGALQLDLGGAPAGPAGTGKTETTKDLAKAIAKQCVVFNCSEGLDYLMMGRFFSGLAQSGAWCCFDEFNRIDIEVLSVIAQQLLTIRNAKAAKVTRFMFEGREIKLVSTCAAFITMNPGYAGRTELPDNLKALFRPMAMMVPDYCMIAEVILYSEGFESSKSLAQKMSQMYKLCSEQLSQQDHYDFGMRALKSVLVMAGSLKRQNPDKNEDVVLIRALRDSNLPKFLKSDSILFEAILQDLFPGVDIPEHNYGYLEQEIQAVARNKGLQNVLSQEKKVIQLYETMMVRHGVMLVGPTGSGKTTVYNILSDVCINLHKVDVGDPFFRPVKIYNLNPKSITMGELFGQVDKVTLEWMDGLMALIIRLAVQDTTDDHQWVVCDGPVDALWVENLNTVLDDNKMLCLANSERIKFTPHIHMLFEVQDLAVASPATVSRCGMVYIDQSELKWTSYMESWMEAKCLPVLPTEVYDYLHELFVKHVEDGIEFVKKFCSQTINQVDVSKIQTMCRLLESLLLSGAKEIDFKLDLTKVLSLVCMTFVFCYLWGIGGNISESNWDAFDTFIRNQFEEDANAKLPISGDLWGQRIDFGVKRMESWEKVVTLFKYSREIPFFEILVPTVDTVRYAYLLDKLISVNQAVLFTGMTGVGKSVVARGGLLAMAAQKKCNPAFLNFSAQTSSARFQEMIESKMEKKRKNIFGSTTGMKVVIMVDDVNMPKPDRYGSQPPIELLRQIIDFGGFYDRQKLFWKELQDLTVCAACAPPGGGRNPISPRLLRHFSILSLPSPSEHCLKTMFSAILGGFYVEFPIKIRQTIDPIVRTAIEIYNRMSTSFLPTPTKSHYIFNLRDLSKCMQGMLQVDVSAIKESKQIYRLFYHETLRVFHDRLVNKEDKTLFFHLLADVTLKMFNEGAITVEELESQPIMFGDFMKIGQPKEERVYEEISQNPRIANVLRDYLDEFNLQSNKELKLVFFMDAVEHLTRIARILRQQRGNALLVGVGGCGKQSLTKLAANICDYKCFQIDIRRGYDYAAYHEDLKQIYYMTGLQNQPTVFLLTDTQIVKEEFLEDLNNILNSGEVPNLFEPDEYEKNLAFCRPAAKEAGIAENNRDGIFQFFINRVRNNLHIVLCMSPVGTSFRSRCRMFPSLVNCCTIDWFVEWPSDALYTVSREAFDAIDLGDDTLKQKISEMCVEIHTNVGKMAHLFYEELRRRYYTTPTSYLELINLYISMLAEKKKQLVSAQERVKNGLMKLLEANDSVDKMKVDLIALEPELKEKSEKTEKLMEQLAIDQEAADEVRKIVKEEEMLAEAKARDTQAIADDAMRDLNEALPALENSIKALDALDKGDISEIRVYAVPPELVQTVMEAVCLLLNVKTDWASAKILLGDQNFLKRLKEFDKDHIPDTLIKKLKKYIDNPKFTPDAVEKVSRASRSLCMWVRAIDLYAHVFRTVEPKRRKHAEAQAELDVVKENLRQKQERLFKVEEDIRRMQKLYDDSVEEKMSLTKSIALTQARLRRAGKLTTALVSEKSRWEESIKMFDVQIGNVIGDVFISAACIAYFGAFTSTYRNSLMSSWTAKCVEMKIPVTPSLTLVSVLADPYEVRQWNTGGLPRDKVSIENAVLVTRSRRWPLMIDPQEQANRWIRNKEATNGLKLVKSTEPNLLRTFETAIRLGLPVLLEDVGETLDPSLNPILLRQTFLSGGRPVIHLGDSDVDYDKNFRLYMTTKLPNPHFMPEVCVKVTVINFTVTPSGLEEQLLGDVVGLERLDLEDQRNQLIVKINTDKNQLKSIEDKILKLLFESEGTILDNEDLINTLNDSKVTSGVITERLKDAEATEEKISISREKYRVVATRGSLMYFVVANMAEVDGMYQFSLKYFKSLFTNMMMTSPKNKDLNIRLQTLLNHSLDVVYKNVSRGLFEKDKLVFSFMLCVEIMRNDGQIPHDEWDFFCRGLRIQNKTRPSKPQLMENMDDDFWNEICDLSRAVPFFECIYKEFKNKNFTFHLGELMVELGSVKVEFVDEEDDLQSRLNFQASLTIPSISKFPSMMMKLPTVAKNLPQSKLLPPTKFLTNIMGEGVDTESRLSTMDDSLNSILSSFQKLMLVKIFRKEQMMRAVAAFVKVSLGDTFVEAPPSDLPTMFADMLNIIPLVFILSPGSDPMAGFQKFVKEQNYQDRVQAISLGQGQGPVAKKLLQNSMRSGDWVFLQNCHLAASWMPELEDIIKQMINKPSDINDEFRLFLSSVPTPSFPVFILQNSVKVTNEPPKGIKSNLRRALNDISPAFYEEHTLGVIWRKLVFGLCFFHSVILERKKFGPLGWNIKYDFNDSDRECSMLNLQMFCVSSIIPWDALTYITSEITYGGRVTDQWDQRCLRTILKKFFHQDAMLDGYKYSDSGLYYAPTNNTVTDAKTYVDSLPTDDPPEIFGMHDNADLVFQHQEMECLMSTVLSLQPRILTTTAGMTSDEIVESMAEYFLKLIPQSIEMDRCKSELFQLDEKSRMNSLTTVLLQEIERYNKLLALLIDSMIQLQKAIKGFVVMSEDLEMIYNSFLNDKLPQQWSSASYQSMKTLSSWLKDLVMRVDFFNKWLTRGEPPAFWISGFYFPQGFLTGALQKHARKYELPIDHLNFKFFVLSGEYLTPDDEAVLDRERFARMEEELEIMSQATEMKSALSLDNVSFKNGVIIYGLYSDGFRWNDSLSHMEDPLPGEMNTCMPLILMNPVMDYEPSTFLYPSPLYKTPERAGVLSTTGHSTNFVVTVYLPSPMPSKYWILKGAALLCQLAD